MKKDYLIITPGNLRNSLYLLIQQKQSRGYNVIIKEVEDFGQPSPDCVLMRVYIRTQDPGMLLLVGDFDKTPGYPLTRSWSDNNQIRSYSYLSDFFYTMGDSIVPGREWTMP